MDKKRWTEEEIEIVLSNFDTSLSVSNNAEKLFSILPNRTLDAIKREMYDFDDEGIIKIKQRKRKKEIGIKE